MRLILLALTFASAATPSWALCPSAPDDASTHFVQNQQALTLCLQAELAASTELQARAAQIQADLQALQLQMEQQIRMQQASAAFAQPGLPFL